MHIAKKGIRALGIAESYAGRERSVLAGVVMRKDLRIDGVRYTHVTVGGYDATEQVINLVSSFGRDDIQVILLGGCVISWFNITNPEEVSHQTDLPVICITYEESKGLEEDILFHFPDDIKRLDQYKQLGQRLPHRLANGYTIYIRAAGISPDHAKYICQAFAIDGKIPEPVRVARLMARAFMRCSNCGR